LFLQVLNFLLGTNSPTQSLFAVDFLAARDQEFEMALLLLIVTGEDALVSTSSFQLSLILVGKPFKSYLFFFFKSHSLSALQSILHVGAGLI
jgi:hypothetical protein